MKELFMHRCHFATLHTEQITYEVAYTIYVLIFLSGLANGFLACRASLTKAQVNGYVFANFPPFLSDVHVHGLIMKSRIGINKKIPISLFSPNPTIFSPQVMRHFCFMLLDLGTVFPPCFVIRSVGCFRVGGGGGGGGGGCGGVAFPLLPPSSSSSSSLLQPPYRLSQTLKKEEERGKTGESINYFGRIKHPSTFFRQSTITLLTNLNTGARFSGHSSRQMLTWFSSLSLAT